MQPRHELPVPRFKLQRLQARRVAVTILALVVAASVPSMACGQSQDDKDKPLPPQDVTVRTHDGVSILATYYPSKLAKDAVPVILLHGSKGSRGDFAALALKLQAAGSAAIAPDLRGYGDSSARDESLRRGEPRLEDLQAMVSQDVEAVKNFLIERNNAGELNIEKLCLVGVEMGAVVAVNFAARDWSWPLLTTGKQGQDVKALVLVSPEWSHRGLRINEAVAHPQVRSGLSVMIIAGQGGAKEVREARRLYATLERYHPAVPPEEEAEKKTLWLRTPATTLQGARLVNEKRMLVDEMIEKFIEVRLLDVDIPWHERRNPLE
jgi:pimeloyl-ACP methyl ester carboxylesterase